jgi:hypothetical protein
VEPENTFARLAVHPHCDLVRDATDETATNGRVAEDEYIERI